MQSAKMKVQKYSGVRPDPSPIGPPQQPAGPSGPNGTPEGPHGPAGNAFIVTHSHLFRGKVYVQHYIHIYMFTVTDKLHTTD